jgi:uncharacterized protein YndB with AHSA1/START domain
MRSDFDVEAHPGWTLPLCALEGHDTDGPSSLAAMTVPSRPRAARSGIVRVARRFRASADRVFEAWLDGKSAGRWLFATASRPIAEVEIDGRIGGLFRLVERQRGSVTEHTGRYLQIVRSRHLAFTLTIGSGREATVTIDIVERRNGCELVLSQRPVSPLERKQIEGRWTGILYGLGLVLEAATHLSQTRS